MKTRSEPGLRQQAGEGRLVVLIRGGGDLATGVAARALRAGMAVVITEVAQPLAVRRLVALAEAVYAGEMRVEDLIAQRVESVETVTEVLRRGGVPVLVDPAAETRHALRPHVLVDARMRKKPSEIGMEAARLVIGLGPGLTAGKDCHAVIETNRGHHMGRVLWHGQAEADSGVPEAVSGFDRQRVLRAPAAGVVRGLVPLGSVVEQGAVVAQVDGAPVTAPFRGALRGLLHDGIRVTVGQKIGDLDPRAEQAYCAEISDKALAVGGGVLEAILRQPDLRRLLGEADAAG